MVAAHKYSNRWNNKFTNKSAGISSCLLFTNTKTNAATNLTWWNNGCCTRLGLVADTIAGKALEHPVVPCTPDRWHYFFSIIPSISVFIFFHIFQSTWTHFNALEPWSLALFLFHHSVYFCFHFFFTFFKALEHTLILCSSSWNNFFRVHSLNICSLYFSNHSNISYIQFVSGELDTAYLYSVIFVKKTRSPQRFDAVFGWWKDKLNVLQSDQLNIYNQCLSALFFSWTFLILSNIL